MPLMIRSASLNDVPALLALEQGAATAAHWTPQEQCLARVDSEIGLNTQRKSNRENFRICLREDYRR